MEVLGSDVGDFIYVFRCHRAIALMRQAVELVISIRRGRISLTRTLGETRKSVVLHPSDTAQGKQSVASVSNILCRAKRQVDYANKEFNRALCPSHTDGDNVVDVLMAKYHVLPVRFEEKIYTGFKNAGLPIPTVSNHFGGVRVVIERSIFQRLNSNVANNVANNVGKVAHKKVADRYNLIRELIKSNPLITAVQLAEKLSVSDRTIERDLAQLQESGSLIREGDKNGGRWIIIG